MSDALDRHADALAGFYRRMIDIGIDSQTVGLLTVDFQKALLAGTATAQPAKDDVKAAAEAKAKKRAEELGQA